MQGIIPRCKIMLWLKSVLVKHTPSILLGKTYYRGGRRAQSVASLPFELDSAGSIPGPSILVRAKIPEVTALSEVCLIVVPCKIPIALLHVKEPLKHARNEAKLKSHPVDGL